MKRGLLISALLFSAFCGTAFSADDAASKGKAVYVKRCEWCHGKSGAGDGPAANYLNPAPRDFTLGIYKWKTTPFDEMIPSEEDFGKMIKGGASHNTPPGWDGMGDTSMPGWADMLNDSEVKDVTAYIKSFSGIEKAEKPPIDLSVKVKPSKESMERGKKLFKDLCAECHGEDGRGDATKKLKDDWGGRTWPRDLTKGWAFRVSNDPKDIYARVTVGIPGTQMPSFADPKSKKVLSDEERWDVANYAASLDEPERKPGDNNVIKAVRVEGKLPKDATAEEWKKASFTSFYVFPQLIAGERHFKPSLNSISVKALYNDDSIAILAEWDDPTRSLPGDDKAMEIADGEVFPDGFAVQFPVKNDKERPYFGMGDSRPVNIWYWQSEPGAGLPQSVSIMNAKGYQQREIRVASEAGLEAGGVYEKGRRKVVFTRHLKPANTEKDLLMERGVFIPVAFAAWDGSNKEKGPLHEMTGWNWIYLEKEEGKGPVYIWPVVIGLLVLGGELLWLRSARKR